MSHDQLVFIPNNKKFECRRIPILNKKEDYSSFQDKICLMSLVNKDAPLLGGYIAKVKGDAGNPIHEDDAIAENYGAIMSWSDEEVIKEIQKLPKNVKIDSLDLITEDEAKFQARDKVVDLRHLPFVTVDPATCKDMDDAIYSTYDNNGNIVCYTAVANVTKYVNISSQIGKRYVNSGFTIYSPNKAYNILPTELSTGICSLNPEEDRLAFVVKTTIDRETGRVLDSQIYDSVIRSKKKYSYEEAQKIVDINKDNCSQGYLMGKIYRNEELSLDEQVLMNYYAAKSIKTGFERRKMIRFNGNHEREIIFDDDLQNVVDIMPVPELEYHEVIEDFMITANEATAKYTRDKKLPNIYRVHQPPKSTKVKRASEFFDILGIKFNNDLSAEGTRELISMIRNTENEEIINKFLIKMQSRAMYDTKLYNTDENSLEEDKKLISHFALQSSHYSHTTSPIRRLPDFITQFNILANIHGRKPISEKKIQVIVDIANARQLEVEKAEKEFDDVSSVIYCEQHIGEILHGSVSKIRYAAAEEGYDDEIIVIVKNDEKGINAEIPLSQIIGKDSKGCEISRQGCAVYDKNGKVVLKLCKPMDFVIEKADRKSMTIVGKTNKQLVNSSRSKKPKTKEQEGLLEQENLKVKLKEDENCCCK